MTLYLTLMPPWVRKASTKRFKGNSTEPRRTNHFSHGFGFNCLRVKGPESDTQASASPLTIQNFKTAVAGKQNFFFLGISRDSRDVPAESDATPFAQVNLKQDSFTEAGPAPKRIGLSRITTCRGKTWPQEPPTHLVKRMIVAWKKHSTKDNAPFTASMQSLTKQIDEFGMFLQKIAIISAKCGVDFTINIIGGVVLDGPRNVSRVCAPVFDVEVVGLPSWYHAWASATADYTVTGHLRILPTLRHYPTLSDTPTPLWAKRWGAMVDLHTTKPYPFQATHFNETTALQPGKPQQQNNWYWFPHLYPIPYPLWIYIRSVGNIRFHVHVLPELTDFTDYTHIDSPLSIIDFLWNSSQTNDHGMAPPRSPPSATAARRPQRPAAPPWRCARRGRFAAPRRRRGAAPNECRPGKIWGEQPENQKKVGKSRNRGKSWENRAKLD